MDYGDLQQAWPSREVGAMGNPSRGDQGGYEEVVAPE